MYCLPLAIRNPVTQFKFVGSVHDQMDRDHAFHVDDVLTVNAQKALGIELGFHGVHIGIATFIPGANAGTSSNDGVIRGQAVVRYDGLNLNNERDARTLLRRIDRAAIDACGGRHPFGLYDGLSQQAFERCRADAVGRAVAALGAPMLIRTYADAQASARRS